MKSVDTLHIYERLKKVKTSDAQARELAEILRELVEDQVATKTDLEKIKLELEAKIQTESEKSKNELRVEIEKSKTSTIKWIIGWVTGLIVAQTGILVTVLKV